MTVDKLKGKVLSEGYCCMYGYLALCEARKETAVGMANNLDVPLRTMEYHRTQYKRKVHVCYGLKDCLKPQVEEVKLLLQKPKKQKGR